MCETGHKHTHESGRDLTKHLRYNVIYSNLVHQLFLLSPVRLQILLQYSSLSVFRCIKIRYHRAFDWAQALVWWKMVGGSVFQSRQLCINAKDWQFLNNVGSVFLDKSSFSVHSSWCPHSFSSLIFFTCFHVNIHKPPVTVCSVSGCQWLKASV